MDDRPVKSQAFRRRSRVAQLAALIAHPARIAPLVRSLRRPHGRTERHETHLRAAIRWLCRAQEAVEGGGVSYGYSLTEGWLPPYPETTGYIIPTFLAYAVHSGDADCRRRAQRMGEWEIAVQRPDGAIPGGAWHPERPGAPVSFDTGQVLQGWCALSAESREPRLLHAASRAGDWLVASQRPDGAWADTAPGRSLATTFAFNVRTSWPLLELAQASGVEKYREAALRNLQWTLARQRPNGWFEMAGFDPDELPITHTVGYVLEGLLECWKLTGDPRLLDAARRGASPLLDAYERRPFLEQTVEPDWRLSGGSACVTGCAQLARVWLMLGAATGEALSRAAGLAVLDQVKAWQFAAPDVPGLDGALPGSVPVYGRYEPFRCPNWGVKFFCDALLEAMRAEGRGAGTRPAALREVPDRA